MNSDWKTEQLEKAQESFLRAQHGFSRAGLGSHAESYMRLAPRSLLTLSELSEVMLECLSLTRISLPFVGWTPVCPVYGSNPLMTMFEVSGFQNSSYVKYCLNQKGEFFAFRTLLEDIEYKGYSKRNIGQCLGFAPTMVYSVMLLMVARVLADRMRHPDTENILISHQVKGIQNRVLFGDLPFNIGIPNPLYRASKNVLTVDLNLSLNDLADLHTSVDKFGKQLWSNNFVRSSSSPDIFNQVHPEFYVYPKNSKDMEKLIKAVELGFFELKKPAQLGIDFERLAADLKEHRDRFVDLASSGDSWILTLQQKNDTIEVTKISTLGTTSTFDSSDYFHTMELLLSEDLVTREDSRDRIQDQFTVHLTETGRELYKFIRSKQ